MRGWRKGEGKQTEDNNRFCAGGRWTERYDCREYFLALSRSWKEGDGCEESGGVLVRRLGARAKGQWR